LVWRGEVWCTWLLGVGIARRHWESSTIDAGTKNNAVHDRGQKHRRSLGRSFVEGVVIIMVRAPLWSSDHLKALEKRLAGRCQIIKRRGGE
jgi:hypothetical protein